MPKLIIPNTVELYSNDTRSLNRDESINRLFYNFRFLWLLEPDDIILLPEMPPKKYLGYVAAIKNICSGSIHVLDYQTGMDTTISSALANTALRQRLKKVISASSMWCIQACYFNPAIIDLADALSIPVSQQRRELTNRNYYQRINSKYEFRCLASLNNIPIPQGEICSSLDYLAIAIKQLIGVTGQVIVKEEYSASGRGNIGIALLHNKIFAGVNTILVIDRYEQAYSIAEQLWANKKKQSKHIIVEVYYPNTGSFTTQLWVPEKGKIPKVLYNAEIRMELTWAGVEIPAHRLSPAETNKLHLNSITIATILQKQGYQGYLCCDAIRLQDGSILFTEINVRPGAETNAHFLANAIFGPDYMLLTTLITRKGLSIRSFEKTYEQLKSNNLLLKPGMKSGVVISTIEEKYSGQMECLFAAPDIASAYEMEKQVIEMFKTC
jgi:hypothetical protein